MMANVVVVVNSSMSAAAGTPVYLAMTGAAAPAARLPGGHRILVMPFHLAARTVGKTGVPAGGKEPAR
jgi:hypothetical protein